MAKDEKKKRSWKDKFRFSVINDKTLEEVWKIILTKYNAFLLITFLVFFISGSTAALIAFTNIREFIPGYPDVEMRRNILMSAIRLDSLEREIVVRDKYFANLNAIISGDVVPRNYTDVDTSVTFGYVAFNRSPEDSALRARIENAERYSISPTLPASEPVTTLAGLHFYPPVGGIVSGKFDPRTRHYGTDIVTRPKSPVSAVLDGTVIFTGWTMETGFIISIQHTNDLISVYKHNSTLMKETGDIVRAGENISVVGDSGELYTSGPHLHLEIWYKGTPMDPEKHIIF
jgi:murein DD-endopeptidase MepM/ murein hydrolase activator NlpD